MPLAFLVSALTRPSRQLLNHCRYAKDFTLTTTVAICFLSEALSEDPLKLLNFSQDVC